MRFAVDAHAIGRHLTGNEVYVRSLLQAWAAKPADCEFVAYVSSEGARAAIPEGIRTPRVASNPFFRLGFDLSRQLQHDRPDLVHVQYTGPLACPVPIVVTVHDVSFLEHPEYFPRGRALQLRWTVRRTVRRAAKVLTGCEFSKKTILNAYPELDERNVVVATYAPAPELRPMARESARLAVANRFSVRDPLILSVGDLQPRKNHIGLIHAFAKLVRANPRLKHQLAFAGKDTWFSGRIREAARQSGVADRIHFLGFVSDAELLHLYNACDVFAFPSFYEGFGLPALEAMACGRAVVCANVSALPEVVDGAAITVDPYSTEEIARALADVLLDAELRVRMERLGIRRAAQFSWRNTAQRTLDVFQDVAERSHTTAVPVATRLLARR